MRLGAGATALGAATKSVLLTPGYLAASPRPVPPSDRIRFGIVGVGMQGSGLLRRSLTLPGVECVAAADLYDGRHDLAKELVGKPIPTTRRYQELLDNKEIDCIIAALPDHWHKKIVVDACNAGKDIYCEKPMTHLVEDGFPMIEAAKKGNRIVQIGAQRTTSVLYKKAKELLAQGAIGKVDLIEATWGRNNPTGAWEYPPPPDLSPETIDWDTWLGTAPKIPLNPEVFACWRRWQAYGSGVSGDLFVHLTTAIHFVTGYNAPPLSAASKGGIYRWKDGRDEPDVLTTVFEYPDYNVTMRVTLNTLMPEVERFMGPGGLLEVYKDSLTVTRQSGVDEAPSYYANSFPKKLRDEYKKQWQEKHDFSTKAAEAPSTYSVPDDYDVTRDHLWNFYQAVRSRQPVVQDAVFGNNCAIACHMANYSYFNKTIARWDPDQKKIVG
jgi:predicted dehydrogenase